MFAASRRLGEEPEALPAKPKPAAADKSLLRLALELKNLIRGDRIFRANAKR